MILLSVLVQTEDCDIILLNTFGCVHATLLHISLLSLFQRSYSFGRFDTSKAQSRLEEHENTPVNIFQSALFLVYFVRCGSLLWGFLCFLNLQAPVAEGNLAEGDHTKGGLGKKMKAISLTMRKKMGKKYTRALSEEMVRVEDQSQCVFVCFFCSTCFSWRVSCDKPIAGKHLNFLTTDVTKQVLILLIRKCREKSAYRSWSVCF